MKKLLTVTASFAVILAVMTMASCTAQTPKASLKTDVDSLSYAIGVSRTEGLDMYLQQFGVDSTVMADFITGLQEGVKIKKDDKKTIARTTGVEVGRMISNQWFPQFNQQFFAGDSTQNLDMNNFLAGFINAATKKQLIMPKEIAETFVQTQGEKIQEKALEKKYAPEKEAGLKFMEENKKNEGVVALPSGLQYKVITEGTGPKPAPSDVVKVHYVGTLINGNEFDSSVSRGAPVEFGVGQVIAGWTEGLQLMSVGSKYKFWIPFNLAYGPQGKPGAIEPFSTLIFEVELLDIVKK